MDDLLDRRAAVHSVVGDRTVLETLAAGARRHPDRVLLVFDPIDGAVEDHTWGDMLDRTWAVADRLSALGVGPGDRVHVHLPNRPEFLLVWFACGALGACMVPTNLQSSAHELAHALQHSGALLSVTDRRGDEAVRRAHELAGGSRAIAVCEDERLADLPVPPDARLRPARATPATDLGLLYTSGTTSLPKAVRITHANYVYAGEVVARNLRFDERDRLLTVLPLFHANAQYYMTMGALVSGATIVLVSRFSASRIIDQAVRHRATIASLFAAPIRMILAQRPESGWRDNRLRVVLFAQNLTADERRRWDEATGAPLVQIYGMTETIGPPLMNPVGDARPDTIGRVSLGYVCAVVREDGEQAQVGEVGELRVHGVPGVSLMRGYLDDGAATAAALQDGWLRTGDVVRVEPDGYLSFVGRKGDMIKRAGENVAAGEVERVLLEHPAVRDAAVFGVPDPVRDQQIVASVVVQGPEDGLVDDLLEWCTERLATFRVPSHVHVVDELPRTAVGKVRKHVLRAAWEETATAGAGS